MAFVPDAQASGGRFVPDEPTAPPAPAAQTAAPDGGFRLSDYDPRQLGEAAFSLGSGAVGQVAGGLSGLAGAALPGEPGQGARWSERVSNALTYEPRGPIARKLVDIAGLPGQAVEHVAGKVGEQGAEVSPGLATVGHTAVHALPALLGGRAATTKKAPLTPKQQQATAAMDAGFRLTPEEMGAGPVARTAASVAGEPRLGKLLTKKNQPLVNDKIATDLGLPKGTPLDLDRLRAVRAEAGQAYEQVRGAGTVTADQTYLSDLARIADKYQTVAKDFPEVSAKTGAAEAQAIVEGLKKPTFSANSAVDLINQLRRSADDAFKGSRTDVAKAMRGGAEAVEGMLERHLAAAGDTAAMQAFRAARERIAKTYVAEKSLVGENINPQAVARDLRKGKPLTGGTREVGEFGDKFERSSQKPTNQGTGPTLFDLGPGAIGTALAGWPGALSFFARPALRQALASRAGQYAMDPRTNFSGPAMQAIGVGSIPRPQEKSE